MKLALMTCLSAIYGLLAHAFVLSPSSSTRSRGTALFGAPEVLTETTLRSYLGEQGLRYAMNKTDKEINEEGDYDLFERVFGQTSNNAVRRELLERLSSGLQPKKATDPAQPPVLTETSLSEYMGGSGLRYNMGKTEKELREEGDYSLFEKMFGQTSKNDGLLNLTTKAFQSSQEAAEKEAAEEMADDGDSRLVDESSMESNQPVMA
mmetsp:Transcript_8381/g.14084  ORF Transcript_8381/g.14084 Transcript_8381/m.14084 type:complete len:207 (-) Transcript_8381:429-1049(-)